MQSPNKSMSMLGEHQRLMLQTSVNSAVFKALLEICGQLPNRDREEIVRDLITAAMNTVSSDVFNLQQFGVVGVHILLKSACETLTPYTNGGELFNTSFPTIQALAREIMHIEFSEDEQIDLIDLINDASNIVSQ